jgi:hypothetical protein
MQKGILIRTGSHCLWKGVYAGNLDFAYNEYLRLKEKYSGFEVTYHDDTDSEFVNAVVDQPGLIQE